MSALSMIRELSDEALNGAIRQLSFNHDWPLRLRQLLIERDRRKAEKKTNP